MTRWLLLIALAIVSAGCRAPGNVYAPYGSTCVPPPGTGAVGAPYYQAPTYAAPYGGYPAGTVPGYQAPPAQGSTSSMIVPGGPQFAISPYMGNDGAWNSSAPAPAVASAPPASYDRSQTEAPIQPRPSGQLIASGARFSRNGNLAWGSGRQPVPASVPYATTADAAPSIATASYEGPVRPSVVRAGVIYDPPIEVAAPIYYPNDYVLDPYASSYDPYVSQPAGNLATAQSGWTPR